MTASADVPAQGPTWYEATTAAERERHRLTFDLDVDVCVIGGGLAGLTVAREVARRNWSVAVLEAHQIAGSASGRNCGFVLPGFAQPMARIAERVGLDAARAMWALADAGRAYVRDTIAETGMPGADPVSGWLRVAKFAEDAGFAAEVDDLRDRYASDVELWSADEVRASLRSPLYCNAMHFPSAFHIHPLNYAQGLAAAAERAGARIFEATPALELDPAGIRKRIVTPSARVRAGKIVLAGNVALGPLQPRLAATLVPITTFVATTAPIGERLGEAIAYRGAVSDTERADNHYRIVGGDRLLWSGAMRAWAADPRRFARRLRADIARTYPQLGRVEIEYIWSGTLGRTVHRMPQIGELSPGVWVASGFGGNGLNTTAMAGLLIARAITEGDAQWRLFDPYELVWAGGRAGRALAQGIHAGARLRERANALSMWWRQRRRWPKRPAPSDTPDASAELEHLAAVASAVPAPPTASEDVAPVAPARKPRRRRVAAKSRMAGEPSREQAAAEPSGPPAGADRATEPTR
jgi:glycine/D-amino acid oxidase-like deaminating enzyme